MHCTDCTRQPIKREHDVGGREGWGDWGWYVSWCGEIRSLKYRSVVPQRTWDICGVEKGQWSAVDGTQNYLLFFFSQSSLYSALLVFYPHLSWTVACLFLDLSQWQALLILFPSISFINTFSRNKRVLLVPIHRRTLASCLLFSQLTPWGPWTSLLSVFIFASVPCCMDLLAHHSEEE